MRGSRAVSSFDRHPRVFGLDLVRAVAVLAVLAAHACDLLEPVFLAPKAAQALAVTGVELFFVLSGFLIGGIIIDTVRRDVRWVANFWVRRWLRTLPNYFLFLALNVAVFHAIYRRWPVFGSYVVFAQSLLWPHPQFFNEAWSLAVEEVFYLLAPLAALAFLPLARGRWRVLAVLVLAAVLIGGARVAYVRAYDPSWDMGVRKVVLLRLDCIVYGVVAAYACRRWRFSGLARLAFAAGGAVVAGYAVWLLSIGWVQASPLWRALFFSLLSAGAAGLLPLAAELDGSTVPAFVVAATRRVALWSYALYLVNLPVQRLMILFGIEATRPLPAVGLALAFVVTSLAWSAATYRWFERPIMDTRDGVARRLGLLPATARVATPDAVRTPSPSRSAARRARRR
jgi:peptidoglycan/LPS O-acetylase OafA/YrhL